MLDADQIDTFARDEILSAWADAIAAVSPHLPGGHPMPVDRIGIARRIAQRLGCTVGRVLEVVGAADG
ncbi:hypothetical protein [Cereibacter sphaeroides]|uniref:hypothetical protein n=1 Tax=Cereibacter sphaeroides TaxID=1063 RepID=UPI00313F21E6